MIGEGAWQGDVVDQAIGWHLRLPTATRADWLAFTAWLEASPDHAATYDRVALDDALLSPALDDAPARPVAANDGDARRPLRFAIAGGGGAIAAALALVLLNPFGGGSGNGGRYAVETASGGRKEIAFADGSRILLNGASRVTLDRANPRYAALDRGEAAFLIRHDAARPFELTSGKLTLRDLGTVFNVTRDGERLGVQVAEGAVQFEPDGVAVTLRPGMALAIDERSSRVALSRVAAADVGGWRVGRLSFSVTPLASVAAAIGRAGGGTVTVAPELADLPFTGTMATTGGLAVMVPRLAGLTGASWRHSDGRWTLRMRADVTP